VVLALPRGFLDLNLLGPRGALGERGPGCFRPPAPLAHMIERRRFRLGPCLFDTGEAEGEVRPADDRRDQAYSAGSSSAAACGSLAAEASSALRLAAAIL